MLSSSKNTPHIPGQVGGWCRCGSGSFTPMGSSPSEGAFSANHSQLISSYFALSEWSKTVGMEPRLNLSILGFYTIAHHWSIQTSSTCYFLIMGDLWTFLEGWQSVWRQYAIGNRLPGISNPSYNDHRCILQTFFPIYMLGQAQVDLKKFLQSYLEQTEALQKSTLLVSFVTTSVGDAVTLRKMSKWTSDYILYCCDLDSLDLRQGYHCLTQRCSLHRHLQTSFMLFSPHTYIALLLGFGLTVPFFWANAESIQPLW